MTREQSISQLCRQMLEVLEVFDASIPPYGLYAAGDFSVEKEPNTALIKQRYPEWFTALRPFISSRGGNILYEPSRPTKPLAEFSFRLPDWGKIDLRVARTSKIKVRNYGSRYHLDKHENYDERWDELRIDRAIAHLWSNSHPSYFSLESDVRMLLFVGFDKSHRPFERELSQLNPHVKREQHNIIFESREWLDKVGRGFSIRTAIWAYVEPSPSAPF